MEGPFPTKNINTRRHNKNLRKKQKLKLINPTNTEQQTQLLNSKHMTFFKKKMIDYFGKNYVVDYQ